MNWTRIILLIFTLCLGYSSCKKSANTKKASITTANYSDYESEWRKVDALEKKGLGKTIIAKVDSLLNTALKEENIPQIFKALVYRSKYENRIEEESSFKILTQFELQIEEASFPLKQLLHSATADLYYQYYNQNRWRFQQRSQTTSFKKEDLRTWSLQDILSKVNNHYQSSLLQKQDLLSFPTENLKDILVSLNDQMNDYGSIGLRPSLYDFLAGRALSYYSLNEGRVLTPQDQFNPDRYALFSTSAVYSTFDFKTNDTNASQLQTVLIFQELLKAHSKDVDPKVLINFDLKRLNYHHANSNLENKDSLYLLALEALSSQHEQNEAQAEIDYHIAKLFSNGGNRYSSSNPTAQWHLKKAHKICSKHAQKDSYGGKLCKILLQQIEHKELSFQLEKVYLPTEQIVYQVQHKNINSLYARLIKVPNGLLENEQDYRRETQEEKIKRFYQMPVFKTWSETVKNIGDYQSHSSELQLDPLPIGKYILLVSDGEGYSPTAKVAHSEFTVSRLSHISRQVGAQGSFQAYVLDRKSGEPVNKAKVIAYTSQYDYSNRRNQTRKIGEYFSDQMGNVKVITNLKTQNIRLVITSQKDTLISPNAYYGRYYRQNEKKRIQTHFFTDRAIYRPGQTVYFKGIVIEKGHHHNELQQNFTTQVSLINKNGEQLQTVQLKTNDYGSFQGSFVLPSSGLNGTYRLRGKYGATYFSVEEYKRPTFEVQLDTNSSQAKINTSVTVSGNVTAFSGAPISGAKVSFQIKRRTSYPYRRYWMRRFPVSGSKAIKNGNVTTDVDGNFTLQFFAEADESTTSKWNPNFNFEITIDATSPSGETQSITETIILSNRGFHLSTNIDQRIQLSELKKLVIAAKNNRNQSVNAQANVILWKLETPQKISTKNYWEQTDYKNSKLNTNGQSELSNFEKSVSLLEGKVSCNQPVNLFGNISPGAYELEIKSKDNTGKDIQLTQRFILFDENAKKPTYPIFSDFELLTDQVEPGESASFLISTGLKKLRLLYQIENDGQIISKEWITLNNEQRKISVPVKEAYRGNFSIQLIGVHSNRTVIYNQTIKVPYSNKKLQLTLGTYRDKVQPGSEENWTITISGMKGEKLAAELLASMYDQSLDQFKENPWSLQLYPTKGSHHFWSADGSFGSKASHNLYTQHNSLVQPQRYYPQLNWFGFSLNGYRYNRPYFAKDRTSLGNTVKEEVLTMSADVDFEAESVESVESEINSETQNRRVKSVSLGLRAATDKSPKSVTNPVRTNFRETAFFYPQLRTDKTGKISFEFKMPEALTEWKFRALAHTSDLKVGLFETSIRTQKELMITPTVPRFFREKDQLKLKANITNLSEVAQVGLAKIRFYNAFTNEKINLITNGDVDQNFNLLPGKSQVVAWSLNVPEGVKAIKYRVIAESANFSDGEEKVIPVLSNRKLITESLPLAVRGNQNKQFKFDRFMNTTSKTLEHHSYSLEFTANPAWYVVQALPYVTATNSECSEKVFSRLYANLIAEKIANSNPKIQEIFKLWKKLDSKELTSKLMQNESLKSILIEETPWLQEAKSESEQKKRIALLFDFNKMKLEKKAAIDKLKQLQLPNGGWSWYKGMRDNRYITQYIISGFGHLKQLGIDCSHDPELSAVIDKGLDYLDQRIVEDYENLEKYNRDLTKNHLGYLQIHYLYTRSFFLEKDLPKRNTAFQYFQNQAKKHWLNQSLYMKGMIALATKRFEPRSEIPILITASLKDNSIQNESLGMYWKENKSGYYWYRSAIETQALMIEVFREIAQDEEIVDELSIWLLKQKQTQLWSNSKSTAIACYALLMNNLSFSSASKDVSISVGNALLNTTQSEAGTGYIKKVWSKDKIDANLGVISVNKITKGVAWGAAYWQYYEDLDQITSASIEELSVSKNIFKVVMDGSGEKIIPIDESNVQVGDKVRIRLIIKSKRDLEFIHLKDQRASGFEPINVLSRYKYQDGLGYYESTKDASTNFFMDRLNKGTYVFEYDLRATINGIYSNGISTLQCQYAPEFNTHSKGRSVHILD